MQDMDNRKIYEHAGAMEGTRIQLWEMRYHFGV